MTYSHGMIADSLITDDDWASAPEDPKEAFLYLYTAARSRLLSMAAGVVDLGPFSQEMWRRQYFHEMEAVAETLGISGLHSATNAADNAQHAALFDATMARIITRIKAENRDLLRRETVALGYHTKETLRQSLEALRAKINASNLSDAVKASLHKKVDAVEAELQKRRSSMATFWLLSGGLALAVKAIGPLADLPQAIETVDAMIQLVHHERVQEEHQNDRLHQPLIQHQPQQRIEDQTGGIRSG